MKINSVHFRGCLPYSHVKFRLHGVHIYQGFGQYQEMDRPPPFYVLSVFPSEKSQTFSIPVARAGHPRRFRTATCQLFEGVILCGISLWRSLLHDIEGKEVGGCLDRDCLLEEGQYGPPTRPASPGWPRHNAGKVVQRQGMRRGCAASACRNRACANGARSLASGWAATVRTM